ncbi:hypothetical protein R1flu_026440 [Riccia fluitans]|uniref:Cytochrome P450 n=1 Tax=Riccia fluitans TaxID=41844 RepID=A0ABD1XFY6_9MARC
MADSILFEDIFTIVAVDPDGKKWDRVRRYVAHSELDMDLLLDVNTDVYPMQVEEKFALAMATTLSLDGTMDDGFFDQSGRKSLADKFEYVMYGKLYKYSDVEVNGISKVEVYISFGGLLMMLKGDPNHLNAFQVDQRLYLLIRKVPLVSSCRLRIAFLQARGHIAFCWLILERVWRPWRLILLCRKQGIKGFPFIPLIGQLPQISKVLSDTAQGSGMEWKAVSTAGECILSHGKIFYFTTAETVRICVADPDLIKDILQNNADCYCKPSFIHDLELIRTGIFASCGDVWAPQRQLLQLLFAPKVIKTEMSGINQLSRAALRSWTNEIDSKSGGELSVHKRLSELTLNVIKMLSVGEEGWGSDDQTSSNIAETFSRYLLNCRKLFFDFPSAVPGYRFLPTKLNKDIMKDEAWLTKVIEDLIVSRSREYVATSSEEREHKDVLDVLLTTVTINGQQVRDNGLTFLMAGHHTTASLLSWCMYLLALHPLWQERARAEVEEFCSNGEVDWNTLGQFKTLSMILSETLRLFPPIPLIGRQCVKENSVGPYVIPPGVEIIIPTAVLHRDKELWGEDADQFQPMRFANGLSKASKHILAYLPFGSGPRTCIGQNLALAEARTILATILPVYSWNLGPGYLHCPEVSLALHPKFDIPIVIQRLR